MIYIECRHEQPYCQESTPLIFIGRDSLIIFITFEKRPPGKTFYFLLKFVDLKSSRVRPAAENLRIKKTGLRAVVEEGH
jgi:hypothetical protein